jgi:hypothetical protein
MTRFEATRARASTAEYKGFRTSNAASSLSSQQSATLHGGGAVIKSPKTLATTLLTMPPAPRS